MVVMATSRCSARLGPVANTDSYGREWIHRWRGTAAWPRGEVIVCLQLGNLLCRIVARRGVVGRRKGAVGRSEE